MSTRSIRVVVNVVILAALPIGIVASPAVAEEKPPNADWNVEQRELLVVDMTGKALDSGGGTTPFGVSLEGDDECPGDSQRDGYRIDSYMIPLADDPTKLDFTGLGPAPSEFREYEGYKYPLQTTTGRGYASEVTGMATESGGPGLIPDIPPFDFHVFVPTPGIDDWDGGVPAGDYRVGVACTYAGRLTNLWETTIKVSEDPTDEPVGMQWTVTGPQPLSLETAPGDLKPIVVGLVVVAGVLAGAAVILQRSSKRAAPPEPEPLVGEPVP